MSNDIKISRELAERLTNKYRCTVSQLEIHKQDIEELRALLAAPVVGPVPPLVQTLHANGDRIAMEATIAQQAQRISDLESAPVVERQESVPEFEKFARDRCPGVYFGKDAQGQYMAADARLVQDFWNAGKVSAEQPAPVAVVLAEVRSLLATTNYSASRDCHNAQVVGAACDLIDKVKELNQ